MKRNCIALIIIIMISVGGAFHLPANAAKPAADKSEKAEYEQRIEQLEKVVQQKTDSITLLDQQMKLAEYVEKKADRNINLNVGWIGVLIMVLEALVGIVVSLWIKSSQRKKLDETSKQAEQSVREARAHTFFMQALKEENLDRMIKRYSQAIKYNPNFAEAYNNRGVAYDDKGDYDKAIEDYNKAIEINPNYAEAYNNRGNAYVDKGDYDNAIKDYDKAIEIDPKNAEAYNNRGVAYYNMGENDKAIEDYNKAIDINPNDAEAYSNRGVAYYNMGENDKAIEDYNKAIEINPNYAEAYNNRGCAEKAIAEMLEKDGKLAEAVVLYKEAVEDFDKFLELWTKDNDNRKNAIQLKQQCEEAIRRLEGEDGMAEAVPLPRK